MSDKELDLAPIEARHMAVHDFGTGKLKQLSPFWPGDAHGDRGVLLDEVRRLRTEAAEAKREGWRECREAAAQRVETATAEERRRAMSFQLNDGRDHQRQLAALVLALEPPRDHAIAASVTPKTCAYCGWHHEGPCRQTADAKVRAEAWVQAGVQASGVLAWDRAPAATSTCAQAEAALPPVTPQTGVERAPVPEVDANDDDLASSLVWGERSPIDIYAVHVQREGATAMCGFNLAQPLTEFQMRDLAGRRRWVPFDAHHRATCAVCREKAQALKPEPECKACGGTGREGGR